MVISRRESTPSEPDSTSSDDELHQGLSGFFRTNNSPIPQSSKANQAGDQGMRTQLTNSLRTVAQRLSSLKLSIQEELGNYSKAVSDTDPEELQFHLEGLPEKPEDIEEIGMFKMDM